MIIVPEKVFGLPQLHVAVGGPPPLQFPLVNAVQVCEKPSTTYKTNKNASICFKMNGIGYTNLQIVAH